MAWRGVFGTVYRGIGPPWGRGCHGPAACARFRRGRRVPAPAARAMGAGLLRARRASWVRGCPVHAARKRFERPSAARNAARGTRRRFLPMGCVVYPRIYAARCDAVWRGVACLGWYIVGYARHGCGPAPAPPRAPVPVAAGASPRPPLAPWGRDCPGPAACARFRLGRRVSAPAARAVGAGLPRPRTAQAFRAPLGARNAARRTAPLALPEPPARTSRQRFGGPQPSK